MCNLAEILNRDKNGISMIKIIEITKRGNLMNNPLVNYTMLVDFYELTMANGYLEHGYENKIACFDMFFRKVPDSGGYAIMVGLEQLIEYISNLKFDNSDIEYLKSKGIFSNKFLEYLRNFSFACDIWSIKEGTPIFPGEPIVKVIGPVMQAQFVETMLLLTINHESLIATKANRIVRAAKGRPIMEFGSRRAQGVSGAIYGARASYIAGCVGTACTISDRLDKIPALGTMAHSWVQLFPTELEAFRAYAKTYPVGCTLLIDTYNVLKSGLPNAITVFNELKAQGYEPGGVRIDSGDITYLTKKIRAILDEADLKEVKIVVSNSLDEYIIRDLLTQGACIDSFGVGERLITSRSEPVFGGVYKLVAMYDDAGNEIPKIKLSENVSKITTPCNKKIVRLYSKENNKAIADVLLLESEEIPNGEPYEIFEPEHTWKRKLVCDYYAKELLVKIFDNGRLVYKCPTVQEMRKYCCEQMETLWDEVTRFENPHNYYVDYSQKLWDIKTKLLNEHR